MFQKLAFGAAVLTLTIAFAGCTTKQPVPTVPQTAGQTTTPGTTPGTLPPGHPGTTSGQPVTQDQVESKVNDFINKNYPGDWKISGTTLSKGNYTENKNYKIVDAVSTLYPGAMVSIFAGEKRISSTVRQGGTDVEAMDYPVPANVGTVLKSGKANSTETAGFDSNSKMLKVFMPLKNGDNTIGVLSISVSK